MKELDVFFRPYAGGDKNISAIAQALRMEEMHSLSFAPWPLFPYKPKVLFSIAYNNTNIYLQYRVEEKQIQAANGDFNTPVYQDSCVEFFISFGDEEAYYNFEFNCIGTVLAGYGKEKKNRLFLSEAMLNKIGCQAVICKSEGNLPQWELTIILPLEVFAFHQLITLKGAVCRANFYKCGDELPEPHFLAWANIESPTPDFHLPGFFGTLKFK